MLYGGNVVFADRIGHTDRVGLNDGGQNPGSRVHQVSPGVCGSADAAGYGRGNGGVGKIEFAVVLGSPGRGQVGPGCQFRGHGIVQVQCGNALGVDGLHPFQVAPGPGQFRLGLGYLGFFHGHPGGVSSLFDAVQDLAFPDIVPFHETHLFQESFHPGPQFNALDRFHMAHIFICRHHVLFLDGHHTDLGRDRLRGGYRVDEERNCQQGQERQGFHQQFMTHGTFALFRLGVKYQSRNIVVSHKCVNMKNIRC